MVCANMRARSYPAHIGAMLVSTGPESKNEPPARLMCMWVSNGAMLQFVRVATHVCLLFDVHIHRWMGQYRFFKLKSRSSCGKIRIVVTGKAYSDCVMTRRSTWDREDLNARYNDHGQHTRSLHIMRGQLYHGWSSTPLTMTRSMHARHFVLIVIYEWTNITAQWHLIDDDEFVRQRAQIKTTTKSPTHIDKTDSVIRIFSLHTTVHYNKSSQPERLSPFQKTYWSIARPTRNNTSPRLPQQNRDKYKFNQ